jgi:hypothetical protein
MIRACRSHRLKGAPCCGESGPGPVDFTRPSAEKKSPPRRGRSERALQPLGRERGLSGAELRPGRRPLHYPSMFPRYAFRSGARGRRAAPTDANDTPSCSGDTGECFERWGGRRGASRECFWVASPGCAPEARDFRAPGARFTAKRTLSHRDGALFGSAREPRVLLDGYAGC